MPRREERALAGGEKGKRLRRSLARALRRSGCRRSGCRCSLLLGPRQGRGHAPRARVAAAAQGGRRRVARAAEAARERDLVCRGKERPCFFLCAPFREGAFFAVFFFASSHEGARSFDLSPPPTE